MNNLLNKFKTHLVLLFVTGIMISCNKDKESAGKYSITYYPDIEIVGDKVMSIVQDEEYVDQGAIVTENGVEIDWTSSGEVDVTTPGMYTITYSAVNKDGFAKSDSRVVFVLPEAVDEEAPSLAGTYVRTANGRTSTVTLVAPGVYYMTDAWGSATTGGNPLPLGVYLISPDGENIDMPFIYTGVSNFGDIGGFGTFDGAILELNTTLTVAGAQRVNVWVKQ